MEGWYTNRKEKQERTQCVIESKESKIHMTISTGKRSA